MRAVVLAVTLRSGKHYTRKAFYDRAAIETTPCCLGLPGIIYFSASFDIYLWCISVYQVIPLHTP